MVSLESGGNLCDVMCEIGVRGLAFLVVTKVSLLAN